ncbi:MAG: TIGR04283 family arsenosugar biosynthesis glycosyltransferase [Vulcanimicrobiaceae bacterium]
MDEVVSVVMPTWNEATNLPQRARELAAQTGPWEWIVADGGSSDASMAIARAAGALVVACERGRGAQLNAGAALATGEAIVFLHADTALPSDAFAHLRAALRDPALVGGNFTFAFDDASLAGRALGFVYALKRACFGVWYGDSAIFVRTGVFRELGGYAAYPIFEDAEFVERLRRRGRTRRLAATVTSSSRRYRGRAVATIVRWTTLFALYKCGISPHRLARFYAPHGLREQHVEGRRLAPEATEES